MEIKQLDQKGEINSSQLGGNNAIVKGAGNGAITKNDPSSLITKATKERTENSLVEQQS